MLEKEINMVAMQHIHDFSTIKNVTREFVLSKERLLSKMQIVVDIERHQQLLLQQMRKYTQIVDQIIEIFTNSNIDSKNLTSLFSTDRNVEIANDHPNINEQEFNIMSFGTYPLSSNRSVGGLKTAAKDDLTSLKS